MKKLLSLFMAVLLLFSVVGLTPTVSADEIQYETVDEQFIKKYWESYWGANSVVKVGDWYYKFTNTYTGGRYLSGVCGYDGNETEITIPTELNGEEVKAIEKFYLFSHTVKTIKIPKEIRFKDVYYGTEYMRFDDFTNLEEIVVEQGNGYRSKDGVLIAGNELCIYPPAKKGSEYVIPLGVTRIATGAFYEPQYLKSLIITQDYVEIIDEDAISPSLENLYFYTTKSLYSNLREEHWSSEWGYSYVKMPRINGTIHCIEGTELHSFYKKNTDHYKNLVVLEDEFKKRDDGRWYFYRGGIIDVNANYSSMSFFTKNLVEYKGKWFFTDRGIWTKKTLFYEHKSKWFYIKNGKWERNTTDLIKYKDKWFYVRNGKWNSGDCTLFKKNGKWFAIRSGKWYKGKAIIKYSGKKFYVNKGFVQFDFSGKVKVDGKTYKIKNGKVV